MDYLCHIGEFSIFRYSFNPSLHKNNVSDSACPDLVETTAHFKCIDTTSWFSIINNILSSHQQVHEWTPTPSPALKAKVWSASSTASTPQNPLALKQPVWTRWTAAHMQVLVHGMSPQSRIEMGTARRVRTVWTVGKGKVWLWHHTSSISSSSNSSNSSSSSSTSWQMWWMYRCWHACRRRVSYAFC